LPVIAPDGSAEKPQAANDDRQQIVEVVSYSAPHLSHRFVLLRLAQCLFNLPPLGYVENRGD
jgi:hypothetical protein